ncbi:MAG: RNB domain-containing ribonuclease [Comamonas sp.]
MYALYEEAGKFLAGRVMSEADSSAQIELDSGKRVKVKAANILLKFEKPAPAELIAQAQALSAEVDLALAWEFASEDEFAFADLARDYFQDPPTPVQQAAALFALFNAPHYFRRAGKGRFKKAPAEILAQALAAIEKKRQIAEQIGAWARELAAGSCPEPVREQLYKILFRPDKNAPEYKAVVEAARDSQTAPLALLQAAGAITSPYQFHWQRFLFDNFPKGTGFPKLTAPAIADELPLAEGVEAFSIDDSQTTEIDDALSVRGLGTGCVTLGIHIAAPGLALAAGDAIDSVARNRLSTVYMPGHKVTMLPDEVVQTYTLGEGQARPALSLYVSYDEATLAVTATESKLERVHIAANLRHDKIEHIVTEAWLQQPDFAHDVAHDPLPIGRDVLAFLYRLALNLKAQREVVRGKPENFNRPDYNFRLLGHDGEEPTGDETVQISVRRRGSPLDLIVAEAMIVANSTWGQWLAECGVPGLYRSQASLLPGVKVRMGTRALPHAGIGVPAYAWSTSPLRRYVDLVNQWQIIACVRHGKTAALAAPFKPKDAQLFAILSAFDAAYSAYNGYQSGMERFWTLRYLQQNGIAELTASVIKERPEGGFLVRADTLPLVLPVLGAQKLERGERLRVRLGEIDLITLDVGGTLVERLGAEGSDASDKPDADAQDGGEDEEDDGTAGPIAIAVDLGDNPTEESAPAST